MPMSKNLNSTQWLHGKIYFLCFNLYVMKIARNYWKIDHHEKDLDIQKMYGKLRLYTNGLSPVWILMWTLRLFFSVNEYSHTPQTNGRSPWWYVSWRCRFPLVVKLLGQMEHLKGRSPVWDLIWTKIESKKEDGNNAWIED